MGGLFQQQTMSQEPANYDLLWIISEICYYLGLLLTVLFIPALTLALWGMSLVNKAAPNYWYLLLAWVSSALIFMAGVGLKNYIYSKNNKPA